MNFLAHLFLAGDDEGLLVGNFIGDSVKGKSYELLPAAVAKGVLLHRAIDFYTDSHPLVREFVGLLRPEIGRYAAVVSDVLMDHILAASWMRYHRLSLADFSAWVFSVLEGHWRVLPANVQAFLPKMKAANRLVSYADLQGVVRALDLMSRYTSLPVCGVATATVYLSNKDSMDVLFADFWAQLQNFVAGWGL